MNSYLMITPRDPLVARDGRPFGLGSGRRMRSTGWLTPGVAAGSFRTAYGKASGRGDFPRDVQDALLGITFAGVLPLDQAGELLLPAPTDCVIEKRDDGLHVHAALPARLETGEDCDLPDGLRPVMISAKDNFKPEREPSFWPASQLGRWLIGGGVDLKATGMAKHALSDLRDHVSIDEDTGAAADGLLFTTAGIAASALPRSNADGKKRYHERFTEIRLAARVEGLPWGALPDTWHPLGGERRLAHWSMHGDGGPWQCPTAVREALKTATNVRMTLVTPAAFAGGWRPPRTIHGVGLTLVGACIQRWRAISGWSYQAGGPKAIRRVVPAGGTYFFTVARAGDAAPLADAWLEAVSDGEQDRRDGFGLAAWGTWKEGE